MNEHEFTENLQLLLEESGLLGDNFEVRRVETFSEAGLMTPNKGLVVTLRNDEGTEAKFQVTVVRS